MAGQPESRGKRRTQTTAPLRDAVSAETRPVARAEHSFVMLPPLARTAGGLALASSAGAALMRRVLSQPPPASPAPKPNCAPPPMGGCTEDWPQGCFSTAAVGWRWGFAVASMLALLAQHRKLCRRGTSKGISTTMLCMGAAARLSSVLSQLSQQLHVRPHWREWDWGASTHTAVLAEMVSAGLWLLLFCHSVYWAPDHSEEDTAHKAFAVKLLKWTFLGLVGVLALGAGMLGIWGPCDFAVDFGCMLGAGADTLSVLQWLPQIVLSARSGAVGSITVPGVGVGGLGTCGVATVLFHCAAAGSEWLAPAASGGLQLLLFLVLAGLSHRHQLTRRVNWVDRDVLAVSEGQSLLAVSDDDEIENEDAWFLSRD
eukprot:COSAG01_NODE_1343_length_10640_cov_46.844322_9_plen_371_part_00